MPISVLGNENKTAIVYILENSSWVMWKDDK